MQTFPMQTFLMQTFSMGTSRQSRPSGDRLAGAERAYDLPPAARVSIRGPNYVAVSQLGTCKLLCSYQSASPTPT